MSRDYPLRVVVRRWRATLRSWYEELDCGHTYGVVYARELGAKRRRCPQCITEQDERRAAKRRAPGNTEQKP